MQDYQPPLGRVLGLLALAAALGGSVFSLLLWFQLRAVRPLNPANYPETLPDFTFSAPAHSRAATWNLLDGWECAGNGIPLLMAVSRYILPKPMPIG